MKRFSKVTLGSMLLLMFLAIASFLPIRAEVELTEGKENKVDLDGDGKDEIITFSSTHKGYDLTSAKVSLNGSKVFSYKASEGDYYDSFYVRVTDINPSDKYQELVIDIDAEFDHTLYVYRFKNKKLKLLFKDGLSSSNFDLLPDQKKGNNVLMYDEAVCALGNHVMIIKNFKIKNKKLVEVQPKSATYTVESNRWGYGETEYTAAKDITVYKNSDGKKAVSTIKSGTVFKLTKLKYVNDEVVYAQITVKGENKSKGWINVKYYDGCTWEDKLVENPQFAG